MGGATVGQWSYIKTMLLPPLKFSEHAVNDINRHWRPQSGGKGGATAMPSPRSFECGEDSDNQTHLPQKFTFSSDFGHLILKMLKIKMLMRVLFTWIVQFSFHSSVDSVCSALLMCLLALKV